MPDHRALVAAWLAPARAGSPEALCDALERGFGAIWTRAEVTLGSVTLAAIADRVLRGAVERVPALRALRVEPTGLECSAFRGQLATVPHADLALGVELLIAELLVVLGSLTAEILTPALHAALTKVQVDPTPSRDERTKDPGP